MRRESRSIVSLPTTAEPDESGYQMVIEVTVSYTKGGANYFTGGTEQRGYYLHVQPTRVGGGVKRFTAFTGIKSLLEPASRFNAKRLDQLAANATQSDAYNRCLAHVLSAQNLTLAEAS